MLFFCIIFGNNFCNISNNFVYSVVEIIFFWFFSTQNSIINSPKMILVYIYIYIYMDSNVKVVKFRMEWLIPQLTSKADC